MIFSDSVLFKSVKCINLTTDPSKHIKKDHLIRVYNKK